MRRFPAAFGVLTLCSLSLIGAEKPTSVDTTLPKVSVSSFNAFTGKISKSKVRMRTAPSLDANIVREMSKGELLIIVGETDEFYAVQPPSDIKGYIFRTYVLDNKVEGNRVNIRLSPNTEAPVIAQMNSGDAVDGTISPLNNKWLEINPPASTRFYIAKEYIEKAGNQHYMAEVTKRRDEVNRLLQSTYVISQQELQKSFPDVQIEPLLANYQRISKDYADFPEQASRAKELQEELQDSYLHKKISYLEAKAESRISIVNKEPQKVASIEPIGFPIIAVPNTSAADPIAIWGPIEKLRFEEWAKDHEGAEPDFYADEQKNATTLVGVVEPYSRSIKNKPGDFVLISKETNLPVAFIYSTKINLHDLVGKQVTLEGLSRPNNHFAYPAYFILQAN